MQKHNQLCLARPRFPALSASCMSFAIWLAHLKISLCRDSPTRFIWSINLERVNKIYLVWPKSLEHSKTNSEHKQQNCYCYNNKGENGLRIIKTWKITKETIKSLKLHSFICYGCLEVRSFHIQVCDRFLANDEKLPFAKTPSVDFGVIAAATDLKAREVSDEKKKHAIECCMNREVWIL